MADVATERLADRLRATAPAPETVRLTITDIVRYAGASGDFNPLHHDPTFARALGHPGVIAMGLLPGGILGVRARRWIGEERLRRLRLRFSGVVLPDVDHTIEARVAGPSAAVEGGVEVELALLAPSGERVVTATAVAVREGS